MTTRAYGPAKGGERACNSCTAVYIEGEMLAVTKFNSRNVMTLYNVV